MTLFVPFWVDAPTPAYLYVDVSFSTCQSKNSAAPPPLLVGQFSGGGNTYDLISKHALEELVARLRKKFKVVQSESEEAAIKSVWGVGYELCLDIHLT